jgi:hypothetical protein
MVNIERYITVFDDKGDFLYEKSIDSVDLEILKEIFPPYEDDPNFIMLYQIGEREASELKNYIDLDFDFTKFQYELSTYQKK